MSEEAQGYDPNNQNLTEKDQPVEGRFDAGERAVAELAAAFHEQWRAARKQEDGSFEPREKLTIDEKWIADHGTDRLDIANTAFEDLPSDWKAENEAAAAVVVGFMHEVAVVIEIENEPARGKVGEVIHEAWLSRNEWAKGGDLDVAFAELPYDEQEKDIAQMRTALELSRNDSEVAFTYKGADGFQEKMNKYGLPV